MAKKKLKYLERNLCDNFEDYPIDGDCRSAPTGEPFITYCSAGSKPEGKPTNIYYSHEEAVDEFEKTIRDIIKMGKGTLYWRMRPQIKQDIDGHCYVRSRFLVSDRPLDLSILEKYYNKRMEE